MPRNSQLPFAGWFDVDPAIIRIGFERRTPQHDPSNSLVTIVVATYNRGAVLARTLRTVKAQTETNWQVIVVGDACTDDTGDRVAALNDPRIRFVNLPERFGEQAGPNSVGMAMADTPYVAFLNHDDLWFPEHLTLAINRLEQSGADLFWSRAAFFTNRGAWNNRGFFVELSPTGRTLDDIYENKFFICEPLSSWVMRRDALMRLGPMKLASQTTMVPIAEYCVRAARNGVKLHSDDTITVLKDRMWCPPPLYNNTSEYAERWVQMCEAGHTDQLRQEIERDIWLSTSLGLDRSFSNPSIGNKSTPNARIDREIGLNLTEMHMTARGEQGNLLGSTLKRRTG